MTFESNVHSSQIASLTYPAECWEKVEHILEKHFILFHVLCDDEKIKTVYIIQGEPCSPIVVKTPPPRHG
jgi:hypothetical protein